MSGFEQVNIYMVKHEGNKRLRTHPQVCSWSWYSSAKYPHGMEKHLILKVLCSNMGAKELDWWYWLPAVYKVINSLYSQGNTGSVINLNLPLRKGVNRLFQRYKVSGKKGIWTQACLTHSTDLSTISHSLETQVVHASKYQLNLRESLWERGKNTLSIIQVLCEQNGDGGGKGTQEQKFQSGERG